MTAPPRIQELLLEANPFVPAAEAQILLAHALQQPRSFLLTWPQHIVTPDVCANFRQLLQRRAQGEPIAYLVGHKEFWSLSLRITPATLIPRPETELLVEHALKRVDKETTQRIADLGTGSGAIALAIAHERPRATVVATDASADALEVAADNAQRLKISNVSFRLGDWFTPLHGESFDMIISNPPYIADDDAHLQQGDLRFEPPSALTCGEDALQALRSIAKEARSHLVQNGWLLLEHGFDQADAVAAELTHLGYCDVATERDYAGIPRVTFGRYTNR